MSVFCTVEKLKNENYNPIFKLQKSNTVFAPSNLDSLPNHENSFVLGFQTEAQKEMLLKHSHKILYIDATHGTNHYDFFLLSLHIQDEYGQGYPVAHFITNVLDFETFLALFNSLRCRVPDLKVNTVITDDDSISFQTFNSVFGPNIKHLLCQWHVYNAWKRQLVSKVHDKSHRDKMLEELLKINSKCAEINCAALCSHLYRCSCQDSSNLCKRIHKVRLVDSGFKTCITDNYYEDEIGGNVSGIDPKILNLELNNISSATESFCSKK
ncbi:hypothetical protein AVEN_105410-1 [Araneus ventricosus]|uniref:MULE transposase domain-containing protein n=1 Tax=Araneus ventricosus TaxID=182803 RepID=A0A4Y2IEQ9_ARAVE|nr:hypothetical protein AVEN_105410-1 [Araneus ventricosus]